MKKELPLFWWGLILLSVLAYCFMNFYLERSAFVALCIAFAIPFFAYYFFVKKFEGSLQTILLAGLLFRIIFIAGTPFLSQDFYRFIWDGTLITHGINPYEYLPDELIKNTNFQIPNKEILYNGMGSLSAAHYSNYPPLNQLLFALSAVVGAGSQLLTCIALKLIIIGADVGIFFIGKSILQKLQLPEKHIAIYFLNPLIIVEGTGNVHFESVMVFFILLSIHALLHKEIWLAALAFASAISVKLVPLMFLPLLLPYLGIKKAISFYAICIAACILFFIPFYTPIFLSNYGATVALWFTNFEFNASIYYIIRSIGFAITGYNVIHIVGVLLPLVTISFIAYKSLYKKQIFINTLIQNMLYAFTLYLFMSTTVHPWYIITLIGLSIFTQSKYAILWSALAILSYSAYAAAGFKENFVLIAIEYIIVFAMLIWELFKVPKNTSVQRF